MIHKGQAFSLSYDLAPPPPPLTSFVSKLSLFLSPPVCIRPSLLTGEGGGGGGAKSCDSEEALALYKSFNILGDQPFLTTLKINL
jgi:hypothetical protein